MGSAWEVNLLGGIDAEVNLTPSLYTDFESTLASCGFNAKALTSGHDGRTKNPIKKAVMIHKGFVDPPNVWVKPQELPVWPALSKSRLRKGKGRPPVSIYHDAGLLTGLENGWEETILGCDAACRGWVGSPKDLA